MRSQASRSKIFFCTLALGMFQFALNPLLLADEVVPGGQVQTIEYWLNLGERYHDEHNFPAALSAYQKALDLEGNRQKIRMLQAETFAASGQHEQAARALLRALDGGYQPHKDIESSVYLKQLVNQDQYPQLYKRLYPCEEKVFLGLDFMLGLWLVTPAGNPNGNTEHSKIYKRLNGCMLVIEYWTDHDYVAESFIYYDPGERSWYQTTLDNQGWISRFKSRPDQAGIAFESLDSGTTRYRISFVPMDNGSFRQRWHKTDNDGETWTSYVDSVYTPR